MEQATANKFKVGDRVRCLGNNLITVVEGKEYVVASTIHDFLITVEGSKAPIHTDWFELVVPAQPKRFLVLIPSGDDLYAYRADSLADAHKVALDQLFVGTEFEVAEIQSVGKFKIEQPDAQVLEVK